MASSSIAKKQIGPQWATANMVGSNFALARQVSALAPAQGDDIIIPIKPTHVNSELLAIFKEAGGKGAAVQELPAFTTVTLVKTRTAGC